VARTLCYAADVRTDRQTDSFSVAVPRSALDLQYVRCAVKNTANYDQKIITFTDFLWAWNNIQIVTGVEVTIGNCFPDDGKYCPTPKAEGNISQTEGKQFPIETDNNSLYLFCVIPHSNANKNTFCGTRYLSHCCSLHGSVLLSRR